jgi:MFS family permease
MGLIADRLSARWALAIDFVIQAIGIVLVFAVQFVVVAPIFVALYGLSVAAPLMLLPLLTAESLGLKRFGFIYGLIGLAQTFGATIGPLVSGQPDHRQGIELVGLGGGRGAVGKRRSMPRARSARSSSE